jgi:Flp pilus assembly protein TadD
VFPNGTAWLVGADDVLLVASAEPLDSRLANIERNWQRPGVAGDLREVAVEEPFSVWTMFVGGPRELAQYSAGAAILTDDRMSLEFSAPRELHRRNAGDNGATLLALLAGGGGPGLIREAKQAAGAAAWRHRGDMWFKSSVNAMAYDDYVRALQLDSRDGGALDGLVRTAVLMHRASDALAWVKSLTAGDEPPIESRIAVSKLLAANGSTADAVEAARQACRIVPVQPAACEQLASLFADSGDTAQLDETVATLQRIAPRRAPTLYYAAVAAFLRGDAEQAVRTAAGAINLDDQYAPAYDLLGAAYTRLGNRAKARDAFRKSLEFDPHDSTAYTNLGLIELADDNRAAAAGYFAEALWLTPESTVAREGLARSK